MTIEEYYTVHNTTSPFSVTEYTRECTAQEMVQTTVIDGTVQSLELTLSATDQCKLAF